MIVLRFIVEIKVACANFDNSSITLKLKFKAQENK